MRPRSSGGRPLAAQAGLERLGPAHLERVAQLRAALRVVHQERAAANFVVPARKLCRDLLPDDGDAGSVIKHGERIVEQRSLEGFAMVTSEISSNSIIR